MALKTRKSAGGKTFLKIFGGKIVQENSKPFDTEMELKERENKNGAKVYYIEYDSVAGMLTHADIRHVEQLGADVLELTISDRPESYVLSMGVDTRFAKSFMTRMLNLDLAKPVEIAPYSFEDKEGKKVSGLVLYQDEQKVQPLYTRETPNGMPDAKQVRKGKEIKWDFTDQTNFLYDEFEKFKAMFPEQEESYSPAAALAVEDDEEIDDLPF